jgi:hypothetical protein
MPTDEQIIPDQRPIVTGSEPANEPRPVDRRNREYDRADITGKEVRILHELVDTRITVPADDMPWRFLAIAPQVRGTIDARGIAPGLKVELVWPADIEGEPFEFIG